MAATAGIETRVASLPPDCVLRVVEFLDAFALCRLQAAARFWQAAARTPHVWQAAYLAFWGTADLPPDCHTVQAAFRRRFLALRQLPHLLLAWGHSAGHVRRATSYDMRNAAMEEAGLATRQLASVAPLVQKYLQAIATGHPSVCVCNGLDGPFGVALPGMQFRQMEIQQYEAVVASANHALWMLHEDELLRAWNDLLDRPETPPLEDGASLISRIAYPDLQLEAVASRLQAIADLVAARLPTGGPPPPPLRVLRELNHVLFEQLGFRGNAADYYSAHNSYLCDVLDRKEGIPISLCVIYAAVARRLGVTLQGVNAPCHFLLCMADEAAEEGRKYIDAFNSGRFLTIEDVFDLVGTAAGWGFRGVNLSLADPLLIFLRMLRNLINIFQQQHDTQKLMLCVSQMVLLMGPTGEQQYGRVLEEYRMVGPRATQHVR